MANPQNLKPFPKGVSGNPNGRPKKPLQVALEAELESDPDILRQFVRKGLEKALAGDFRYWAAIFDRIDGKVPMPADVQITDARPTVERVTPYSAKELEDITRVLRDAGFDPVQPEQPDSVDVDPQAAQETGGVSDGGSVGSIP